MDAQVSPDVVATGPEQLERNERRPRAILVPGRVERDARSHTIVRSSLVHQTTWFPFNSKWKTKASHFFNIRSAFVCFASAFISKPQLQRQNVGETRRVENVVITRCRRSKPTENNRSQKLFRNARPEYKIKEAKDMTREEKKKGEDDERFNSNKKVGSNR